MLSIEASTIIFIIINLLVLFIALRLVLFKPVQRIIEQRQKEAESQFREAEEKLVEANDLKAQYEKSLKDAEDEQKKALAEARRSADEEYQKIIDNAKKEATKVKQEATAKAEEEKEKILKGAEQEIADMVVDAARKIMADRKGSEVDGALYNKFLEKAGDE